MKKIVIAFILLSFITYARELPIDKETFLFKSDSISYISSAYSNLALYDLDSITVNPAALVQLNKNYITVGYNYYDSKTLNYYLSEEENILNGKISYIAVTSNKGGVFLRRLAFGKTEYVESKYSQSSNHKYNLDLYEIGLAVSEKSETVEGLSTGFTGKLYTGSMLEAGGNDVIVDRGYGFGFDLGFIYKKDYISTALTVKDILGNIYWKEYDRTKINTSINLGLGMSSEYVSYSFSVNKIFLDTSSMTFGQGIKLKILNFPVEYSNYMIKGLQGVLRFGNYGEDIFNGDKYTYGLELSNEKYYLDGAIVSDKIGEILDENNVYKFSIGMKF